MPSTANTQLSPELFEWMQAIRAKAIEYGLDFYEVVYEVLSFDTMNQIASYGGFPVRYPHWKWGMEYESLSKRDAYGMGRIYEMVINTDPVYAYLQESNAVVDQKLVMAHVYGHADFFKNNYWFAKTNRKMMDEMANHSTRVRRHIDRQGQDVVERFLDACLSIEHLIDPHSVFMNRSLITPVRSRARHDDDDSASSSASAMDDPNAFVPDKLPAKDYMDPYINPQSEIARQRAEHDKRMQTERAKLPQRPTRDVLLFLLRHAHLADWQSDILSIIRDEAYYFAPQAMTKVMNEGWAVYWHSKLMTQHFVEAKEIIQYADQHSGVLHMAPGGFNPYKIGYELFRDIERRWNTGQHGPAWERLEGLGAKERHDDKSMKGREKIFEVRKIYNDVQFIDEFLTPEFVDRHKMYQYRRDPQSGELKVVSRDFDRIKKTLLYRLTNMGQPFVYVVDGNYRNRGELYLAHQYSGLEVELAKAKEVLRNIRIIWGRPVHLQARIEDDEYLFTCEDPTADQLKKEKITASTPAPAHLLN
ncbi:MAG: SpoVR family protein [Phycisphaerales bacterium]|nr:SpoVR family protein [Phycisphaerales bacterium]